MATGPNLQTTCRDDERWSRLAVRGKDRVRVDARTCLRVGVHQGRGQAGQRVQEIVFGGAGDAVGLDGTDVTADGDLAFGPELVTDPAQPDGPDVEHAGCRAERVPGLVD